MKADVIDKIDVIFNSSRVKYGKVNSILKTDSIYNFHTEQAKFFSDSPKGLRWLMTLFSNWRKKGTFREEIYSNIKADEIGYFKFLNNTFEKQYTLINSFNKAYSLFFNDPKKSMDLIESLDDGVELDKPRFILAIQLYYILIFDVLEKYVAEQYANYTIRLTHPSLEKPDTSLFDINIRNINKKIDLLPLSDDQIKKLYKQLKINSFIDDRTKYTSVKRILIQKDRKDQIIWIDLNLGNSVNKVTLLILVSHIVKGDTRMQNYFITKYCRTSYKMGEKRHISLNALKKSRQEAKKTSKNCRRDIVNDLVINVVNNI